MSWGMGGVPNPSKETMDRIGQVETKRNTTQKPKEDEIEKKDEPYKTQQMRNLEAYQAKYAAMSTPEGQKDVVKQLLSVEKELQNKGYSVNLSKYLQQKGVSSDPSVPVVAWQAQSVKDVAIQKAIDVESIKDASWMRPVKYTTQREESQAMTFMQDIQQQQELIDEEPLGRRMGFGQGGGAANLGLTGYQTLTEPTNFTEWIAGRINTPISEPETITKEPEIIQVTPEPIVKHSVRHELEPVNKSIILIGAVIGIVALLLVWRIKK